jgi:hypothetical protein
MMMLTRLARAGRWAVFVIAMLGMPALAEDLAPAPTARPDDPGAVQAFGGQNPTCLEWTDACFICQRAEDASVNCSTAGIACTAQAIVCRRHKD